MRLMILVLKFKQTFGPSGVTGAQPSSAAFALPFGISLGLKILFLAYRRQGYGLLRCSSAKGVKRITPCPSSQPREQACARVSCLCRSSGVQEGLQIVGRRSNCPHTFPL